MEKRNVMNIKKQIMKDMKYIKNKIKYKNLTKKLQ